MYVIDYVIASYPRLELTLTQNSTRIRIWIRILTHTLIRVLAVLDCDISTLLQSHYQIELSVRSDNFEIKSKYYLNYSHDLLLTHILSFQDVITFRDLLFTDE